MKIECDCLETTNTGTKQRRGETFQALASKKGSLKVGYRAGRIIQNSWKLFYPGTISERDFSGYKAKKLENSPENV